MIQPNAGIIDRLIRACIAIGLFILAWYWIGSPWRMLAFAAGALLFGTAVLGYCHLYKIIGIDTNKKISPYARVMGLVGITMLAILAIGGAWASHFFTRKFFLEDIARMNRYYKLTLFQTGQTHREEAIKNFNEFEREYSTFSASYATYRPRVIAHDQEFASDVSKIGDIRQNTRNLVYSGDLKEAHTQLESIRPILQGILKRNSLSLLAVALTDFHDAMELVITNADTKDARGVLEAYTDANEKLKAVEEIANDDAIQAIRRDLETVRESAERDDIQNLPTHAATMKSSFIKVYLDRG